MKNHWSEHLNNNFREYKKNKKLTVEDLLSHNVTSPRIDSIDFDVTKAEYFDEFQKERTEGRNMNQFKLDDKELDVLKKNGFVVSERNGSYSFVDVYLMLYNAHVPVFVSLDSMLHAWHSSFDKMLEEAEAKFLHPLIVQIVSSMRIGIREIYGTSFKVGLPDDLTNTIQDVDFFLGTASMLLSPVQMGKVEEKPNKNNWYTEIKDETKSIDPIPDTFGVSDRIENVIQAVQKEIISNIQIFGNVRKEDFSQFKPRGHYDRTDTLKRYFRAMMWFGRMNLYVTGKDSQPSELGASLLMLHLMTVTKSYTMWSEFDNLLRIYVGHTDSLNFDSLQRLVQISDVCMGDVFSVNNPTYTLKMMENLQEIIMKSSLGKQLINSTITKVDDANTGSEIELPRAFTFMGQRFTIDNWMHTKVVYGEMKGNRRNPSALDVAYSVFNNLNVTKLQAERMTRNSSDKNFVKFRDGVPYPVELEATRQAIGKIDTSVWRESIYMLWLDTLRELSKDDEKILNNKFVPQFLKTHAWAMKDLETQLGSWAQLRHDSLLYVKQGYGSVCACDYPHGYVDPRVNVWTKFILMVDQMALVLKSTCAQNQVSFLQRFSENLKKLAGMAEKELNGVPFDKTEEEYIKNMAHKHIIGSGGEYGFDGWYCKMFYGGPMSSAEWDPIVADVFTNPPCELLGDEGAVLLQGVGNINTMYMVADFPNGKNIMFASPVFSHFEMYTNGVQRMTDGEWRKTLREFKTPDHPEWTKDYLVPGKLYECVKYKNPNEAGYNSYWNSRYCSYDF